MINQVTLIGHAGRDIEVRTLENGTKVGTFSLATTESYKDKSDQWQKLTEWHNIVVWRPSETVCKIAKGDKVFIQGKITNRKYADKDAVERQRTEIVAGLVKMLDPSCVGSQHTTDIPSSALQETQQETKDQNQNITFDDYLPF